MSFTIPKWLAKLHVPVVPLPEWVKFLPSDLQSVFSMTPVVVLIGASVMAGMWYDMQNRFTKQSAEIIRNQIQIQKNLELAKHADQDFAAVQNQIVALLEKATGAHQLSLQTLKQSHENRVVIEDLLQDQETLIRKKFAGLEAQVRQLNEQRGRANPSNGKRD